MKKLFLFLAAAFTLCATAFADITVKAKVPSDWGTTISIYIWDANNGESTGIKAMTADGDWYTYTSPASQMNIIFINGTGWTTNTNQTVDLQNVNSDRCYQVNEGSDKRTATLIDCESGEVAPPPVVDGYWIKHPWGGGQWTYQLMTQEGTNYVYTGIWGGSGANIANNEAGADAAWFAQNDISGASGVHAGDEVKFTYDPTTSSLSLEILTPGVPPVLDGWYVKHPWNGGEWTWEQMTQEGDLYKYTGLFGGNGANVSQDINESDPTWRTQDEIGASGIAVGTEVTFVYDPATGSLYIEGAEPGPGPIGGEGYWIKHPWGTGQDPDWVYKQMNENADGTYSYTGEWGGTGANIATSEGGAGEVYYDLNLLGNPSISLGSEVTFIYDPATNFLYIDGVTPGPGPDPIDPPSGDGWYIKHPWGTGANEDWTWQAMEADGDVYKYTGAWGGVGADIADNAAGNNAHFFDAASLGGSSIVLGANVTFVYDPATGTLSLDGAEVPVGPGPGPVVTDAQWFLFGYINGVDYSAYDYPFVDGVATLPTLTADSYVFIHRWDDGKEFFTDGWTEGAATVTMIDGDLILPGNHNKLLVPVGTQYVYMCDNGDGSYTVSREPLDCSGSVTPGPGPDDPPTPIGTVYYIKHPWGTGRSEDWAWVQMEANADGTYTCTGAWGGVGANINTVTDDSGADWIEAANIAGAAELVLGDQITFVYNPSTGSLAIASSTGVEQVMLDIHAPLYNILGQPVDASYKGIVIQNGRKYIK